jgi:DNA repair protein RadC
MPTRVNEKKERPESLRGKKSAERWSCRLRYDLPKLQLYLVNEAKIKRPWPTITSAEDAARLLRPLSFASEEHFVSLHLNAKFEVIGMHEVSHGTLSASLVHPREVFKAAMVANSYAILVCHNHPSGAKLAPSPEDLETTRQLIAAGKILGVNVLDHIILGLHGAAPDNGEDSSANCGEETIEHFSLRQEYPALWLESGE